MREEALQADVNWYGVLAHHARAMPDKAIAIFESRSVSYGEMDARAVSLAAGLHEHGHPGSGDVVALLSYNSTEFLETIFAANYLGAIVMPINWRLAAPEVHYLLDHSGGGLWCATKP